ncbi:MAG TPA: nuclear transport factor 2 family protein [Pyrinomonadaceae bacterium]|nr:nuclear transport factor 2 family protein [Pyrinomonadaceae bacterium]
MRQRILLAASTCFALLLSSLVLAQKESVRKQNRRALVQMERDFARAAATKGTRDAFLEFLADDGIIFQPGPVNGKKFWTARQPRAGLLSWEPVFADVSRAGDLGYTTGPWEFRPNGADDKPVAFGQYFTIWKKQNDGAWKFVLDRGVTSEKPFATRIVQFPLNDEDSTTAGDFNVQSGRASLTKLEAEFSQRSVSKGALDAFDFYLAEDARLLRENVAPAVGKNAALNLISAKLGTLSWEVTLADISASGDLGYSYGIFEFRSGAAHAERGSYVRVWKKQKGKWKVVMDVMSPDPKK